jgi:hypothetical protein
MMAPKKLVQPTLFAFRRSARPVTWTIRGRAAKFRRARVHEEPIVAQLAKAQPLAERPSHFFFFTWGNAFTHSAAQRELVCETKRLPPP